MLGVLIIYTKFLCPREALVETHRSTILPLFAYYSVSAFDSCNTAQSQGIIFLKLGIRREDLSLLTFHGSQPSCFTYAHPVDIARVGW